MPLQQYSSELQSVVNNLYQQQYKYFTSNYKEIIETTKEFSKKYNELQKIKPSVLDDDQLLNSIFESMKKIDNDKYQNINIENIYKIIRGLRNPLEGTKEELKKIVDLRKSNIILLLDFFNELDKYLKQLNWLSTNNKSKSYSATLDTTLAKLKFLLQEEYIIDSKGKPKYIVEEFSGDATNIMTAITEPLAALKINSLLEDEIVKTLKTSGFKIELSGENKIPIKNIKVKDKMESRDLIVQGSVNNKQIIFGVTVKQYSVKPLKSGKGFASIRVALRKANFSTILYYLKGTLNSKSLKIPKEKLSSLIYPSFSSTLHFGKYGETDSIIKLLRNTTQRLASLILFADLLDQGGDFNLYGTQLMILNGKAFNFEEIYPTPGKNVLPLTSYEGIRSIPKAHSENQLYPMRLEDSYGSVLLNIKYIDYLEKYTSMPIVLSRGFKL